MGSASSPPIAVWCLVVAPRVKLTWSVPVKVPVDVDAFGNVVRWLEVDREIAGHWDDRVWRDHV